MTLHTKLTTLWLLLIAAVGGGCAAPVAHPGAGITRMVAAPPGPAAAATVYKLAKVDAPVPANPALDKAVTKILSKHFKEEGPGAAVLIEDNGVVKLKKYYGMANLAAHQPITPQTVFDLASMSKEFTATAALLLVSDGKFSLNDPVRKVLPDFHVPVVGREVRVSDLVYHLSGLADYTGEEWEGSTAEFNHLTNEAHLRWINGTHPRRAPGMKWEYNNSNYALLSLIIERASGMPFSQFIKTRLFGPAGMSSSVVHDKLALHLSIPNLVTGYKSKNGAVSKSSEWTQITGDGNVLTTLEDMARWDRALRRNTILNDAQKKIAWTSGRYDNNKVINDEGTGYGFGWNIDTTNDMIWHTGSWMGTSTYIMRYLKAGVTIVVLSNDENAEANDIANEIDTALENVGSSGEGV